MSPTVWLDGALTSEAIARIAPADRGLLLADGVFETIRIRAGSPMHWERHLRRLHAAAALLDIAMPHSDPALHDALMALCADNQAADGSARLTLTRGPGPRGLAPPEHARPTVLLTVAAGTAAITPITAVVARGTRRNEFSPLSRIKSLNYGDSLLARREAATCGADEAVLLNTQGRLAETTVANLVLLSGTSLLTPPLADGALPGIARALMIERCGVREAPLHPGRPAQAAFAVSSLGVRALLRLDDTPLDPEPAVLRSLREALDDP